MAALLILAAFGITVAAVIGTGGTIGNLFNGEAFFLAVIVASSIAIGRSGWGKFKAFVKAAFLVSGLTESERKDAIAFSETLGRWTQGIGFLLAAFGIGGMIYVNVYIKDPSEIGFYAAVGLLGYFSGSWMNLVVAGVVRGMIEQPQKGFRPVVVALIQGLSVALTVALVISTLMILADPAYIYPAIARSFLPGMIGVLLLAFLPSDKAASDSFPARVECYLRDLWKAPIAFKIALPFIVAFMTPILIAISE